MYVWIVKKCLGCCKGEQHGVKKVLTPTFDHFGKVQAYDSSRRREYGTTMSPLVTLPNKQQIRHFGVVDHLNLKIHNKKKDQSNELFNKQVSINHTHLG